MWKPPDGKLWDWILQKLFDWLYAIGGSVVLSSLLFIYAYAKGLGGYWIGLAMGAMGVCAIIGVGILCRIHKVRNVLDHLPQEQKPQVKSLMRAAYKLPRAEEGMARMEKLAQWLERDYPDAARSLREGLAETFTINRLDVPPELRRCLATTNLIESPQSGVRMRTRKITRWRDAEMVLRWVAGAYQLTERSFRRMMGYEQLWALAAILGRRKEMIGCNQQKVA